MCATGPKVGVAIAAFNAADIIERCLEGLQGAGLHVVLFDDGSTDATVDLARRAMPEIDVVHGDGDAWWGGGTRRAAERCLEVDCDYVVLLNPDVEMTVEDIEDLIAYAQAHPYTIVAPLVVQRQAPDKVAWAGSTFGPLHPKVPWIWTSRFVVKEGQPIARVGRRPYHVDEAHGRGVVLPRQVVDRIGLFDDEVFPHYGADNDYSFRARSANVDIVIVPEVQVRLDTTTTGMKIGNASLSERVERLRPYLLEQKHGDALRVWWELMRRHVPPYAVVPSYVFNLSLNIMRRLTIA